MIKKLGFIIVLFACLTLKSQVKKDTLVLKNGIDKPSLLPIHHFGLFSSRINQNFKTRPTDRTSLNISYASANIFHPFVEQYLPKDIETQNQNRLLNWYDRHFFKDQETTPAHYANIEIDAVFKNFRVDFTKKINTKHEISATLRSYLVTKGKYPFSTISSDEFIEWFHSNVAGGEDPFGRKFYGLNEVNVNYQDRNGQTLTLKDGQFIFAGIEANHFYYPGFKALKKRNIFVNFGSHLGINTSKYNPSLDVGISVNIIKKWTLKNKNELRAAMGLATLAKNVVNFKTPVDLGNNPFLGSVEAMFEYTEYTRKKNYHSVSVNFQMQSRFFKGDERNYYQLVGDWQAIHSGWSNGFEKLYDHQSAWSWLYTYGRKNYNFTVYIKQDLYLNNSPDIQTGISVKIPISKQ